MSPLSLLSSAVSSVQNAVNSKSASLSQIGKDLQSGNVSGAEQTFSSLLPPGMLPSNASGPIATDFASLGKALSSGILSQAQNALSQLSTDLKTAASSVSHSASGLGSRISYYANEAAPQGLNLLG